MWATGRNRSDNAGVRAGSGSIGGKGAGGQRSAPQRSRTLSTVQSGASDEEKGLDDEISGAAVADVVTACETVLRERGIIDPGSRLCEWRLDGEVGQLSETPRDKSSSTSSSEAGCNSVRVSSCYVIATRSAL